MTDFKSELETLLPCKELFFEGTPGFGRYAFLLSHSIAHPAKMNTNLTEYLINELTKPGEVVLDPMSGTAQTGLIAVLKGRDAICVELEEKFHNWQLQSKNKVDRLRTGQNKGKLSCVLGDARKLSQLLSSVDAVVTSPPYSETLNESKNTASNLKRAERLLTVGHDPKEFFGGKARNCQVEDGARYSHNPENIGNFKHGNIDTVISSPPYAQVVSKKHGGIDPNPSMSGGSSIISLGYSESPDNIGNLPMGEVDTVITSPPYEKTIKDHGTSERATKINLEKNNVSSWAYNADNPDNIGNKSKETYLEAMLQVYSETFKVLKSGGTAAIIVKPFIRNRKVVDLPYQTWLLMEKCGFNLTKLFKLRLDAQSFWRILYMQKNSEVPELWHEYVLVCTKPFATNHSKELTSITS